MNKKNEGLYFQMVGRAVRRSPIQDKFDDLILNTEYLKDACIDAYCKMYHKLKIVKINTSIYSSYDALTDAIEDCIDDFEIINFNSAMKFLSENDNTLCHSLELAASWGDIAGKFNSAKLATLLFRDLAREELGEIRKELEELYLNNN